MFRMEGSAGSVDLRGQVISPAVPGFFFSTVSLGQFQVDRYRYRSLIEGLYNLLEALRIIKKPYIP